MNTAIRYKDILRLAAPISFALLIPQLNFLTNTAFVGRLGQNELGVNGISGVFYLMLAMVGYGLNNGMQVLMARRMGEKNLHGLGQILSNGFILTLSFSCFLILLTFWLAPIIFAASLHNSDHFRMALDFIHIRIWGLPFLLLTQLANAFFVASSSSKFIVRGSLMATVINIAFDYILIYGNFGASPMGLNGAAIASVFAEIAACIMMWSSFFANNKHKTYYVKIFKVFDLTLSLNTLKLASPLIVQYFFSIGGWLIFFFYVEHLGTQDLAASQMLRSILGIAGVCTWAFASSCNTLVSQTIGKGLQEQVPNVIRKVAYLSFITTLCIALLLLLAQGAFLSMYTNDEQLITHALPALRIVVLGVLIMSVGTVIFNGVLGTGNTRINLIMEVISVLLYIAYCYVFIEQLKLSLSVAWFSEVVYWLALLLMSLVYLRSGKWKNKKI